jgi:hypothetical protein
MKVTCDRPPTARQIQLLHVLPAQLGWDDEERRGYLDLLTGKTTSKALSHREATLVIDRLYEQVRGDAVATHRADGATRAELALAASLREQLGAARFDGLARRLSRVKGREGHETADLGMLDGRRVRAVIQAARSILAREECGVRSGE